MAFPTALPEGSRTVERTRTFCVPFAWFSTSVRMDTVATPCFTRACASVPHFFTWTGAVLTSQT